MILIEKHIKKASYLILLVISALNLACNISKENSQKISPNEEISDPNIENSDSDKIKKNSCKNLKESMVRNFNFWSSPPWHGTIFVNPKFADENDPSSFKSIRYKGQETRRMYDRRPASWITENVYLFEALYGKNRIIEIQVNPEFSESEAERAAKKYGFSIGQLPAFLLKDVETVWIHKGLKGFGGGNRNLLIHTEQGEQYIRQGILEETLIHEATHTSIDSYHKSSELWKLAQKRDGGFISNYAENNPDREDLAETMPLYLAYKFRKERLEESLVNKIEKQIPNRIKYLDCQGLSMDILK